MSDDVQAGRPVAAQGHRSRRRLDVVSLVLLLVGLVCGGFAGWLVVVHGATVVILAPSLVAVVTGATHLTHRQAPRQ